MIACIMRGAGDDCLLVGGAGDDCLYGGSLTMVHGFVADACIENTREHCDRN